jgi:hypothetical protein
MKCPGQDTRYWRPGDIFEVPCPQCGTMVEFCKDEPSRRCPSCRHRFVNPRLDLGCLQWCEHADDCLAGKLIDDKDPWNRVPSDDGEPEEG